MTRVLSLKQLCLFFVIENKTDYSCAPADLKEEINKLHKITPENIVEKSKKSLGYAFSVYKNKWLFNRLGHYVPDSEQKYINYFASLFLKKQVNLNTGEHIFNFLGLHKQIYEKAKHDQAVMSKLSGFQRIALDHKFNGEKNAEYQFYKYGK